MHRWSCTFVVLIGSSSRASNRLVHSRSIDSSTTNRSDPSGRRTRPRAALNPVLQADAGGEPGEEHSVGREHPPHLVHHAAEVRFIRREVQHRAANHRVRAEILPGQAFDLTDLEILRRQRRGARRRQASHRLNRGGISIDAETVKAAPKEIHQVPTVSAPGIEDAPAAIEAALRELIEQVDVDLSKRRAELRTRKQRHGIIDRIDGQGIRDRS